MPSTDEPTLRSGCAARASWAFSYKYYDRGLELDIFIKDARTNEPMIGMVWPMWTVFPDYLNPTTDEYWRDAIGDFFNMVDVDGLWIDMNEPVRNEADPSVAGRLHRRTSSGDRADDAARCAGGGGPRAGQLLYGVRPVIMQLPRRRGNGGDGRHRG